jgi:alpha-L-rhamnosidase
MNIIPIYKIAAIAVTMTVSLLVFSCGDKNSTHIVNLKTNYDTKPIGIDTRPYLSWQISSSSEGVFQSAHQILAASSPEKLNEKDADLWNSGKIISTRTTAIAYEGKDLSSRERVYWKIRSWDQNEQDLGFSETSFWEMGLLDADDWEATWISAVEETDSVPHVLPSPYFRKEFIVTESIKSARLYISGLGYYETFINGQKVGDHVLDPMLTRYDRRVRYVTFDVTDMVKKGGNAVGVVLGNGWYNQHTRTAWDFDRAPWRESPTFIYQLEIMDGKGMRQVIKSDESWKYATGPIAFNGIHNGETYDARKELGDWTNEKYNDNEWMPIVNVNGPAGYLSSQSMPPIRVISTLKPDNSWQLNDSVTMIDMGQNITGWGKIKVRGPEGSMVKLTYGERIFEDGSLDLKELSRFIWTGDTQTDRYILKGSGVEIWHPIFVYHGFQYIELTRNHPEIEIVEIEADVVHSDLRRTGHFRSSNELFNKLQKNIGWSFLGNYHGYPTDCPHREKMGWTGDALLVAEVGLFNFDITNAYLKWIDDFIDEMKENGQLPGIIPTSGWGYTFGKKENRERGYGPQWEGAFMEVPWQMYRFTGDTSILERYYPKFKKYVDYLTEHSNNYLLDFGIDDHKQLVRLTNEDYLSSAFYYYLCDMLSKMACATNRKDDATDYSLLADKIKLAFNEKYYDRESGLYDHGGQTPMALALYFGLTEKDQEERVVANLLKVIREKEGHIDAGVVGTKAVVNVLMKYGKERELFEMANKRTFPGWGYWVDVLGANTMYQNWDGSQSRNHIMFGSIGDYFFKGLAGINIDDQKPGFRHFTIKPSFDNDIDWVEVDYESIHGYIASYWRKEGDKISIDVTIPANCTADILIPDAIKVRVNKLEIKKDELANHTDSSGSYLKYSVKSGKYQIELHL